MEPGEVGCQPKHIAGIVGLPVTQDGRQSDAARLHDDLSLGAGRFLLNTLPFRALPAPKADAVCLLGRNIDDWGVVFGAFLLAKQAKIPLAYATIEQRIPDAGT